MITASALLKAQILSQIVIMEKNQGIDGFWGELNFLDIWDKLNSGPC